MDTAYELMILQKRVSNLEKLFGSLAGHRHDCPVSTTQSSTPLYSNVVYCPIDGKPCNREIKACCSCDRYSSEAIRK